MRTLVVHNMTSGFGSAAIFEFIRALVRQGDECVLRVLPKEGGAHEALADAEKFDVVVLSGGDGTVTNLLFELKDRGVPTCIFPSGTANLLHANLGNASDPTALALMCRTGSVVNCDLASMDWVDEAGVAHERGFGMMAGTGFDAQLMEAAAPNKKTMGDSAYFAAALSNTHPDTIHFSITCDGEKHECDGIACLVADNAMMQGEIQIVPDCSMTDGKLDVIVLAVEYTTQLLSPIITGLFDHSGHTLGRPNIIHFSGANIHVEASEPIPLQVDGDPMGDTISSYDAHVIAGCCPILVDHASRYHDQATHHLDFGRDEPLPFPVP